VTIRKTEPSEFRAGGRPLIAGFLDTALWVIPVCLQCISVRDRPIHKRFGWKLARSDWNSGFWAGRGSSGARDSEISRGTPGGVRKVALMVF